MRKRYDSSGIQNSVSSGIKLNGAEIEDNTLFIYQIAFPIELDINYIKRIESGVLADEDGASHGFEITMASKRKVTFFYSLMGGATLRELLADLLEINPSITLDEMAKQILGDETEK